MVSFIFAIILVLLMLLTITLSKSYNRVPIKELKRQARQGSQEAKQLYGVTAYGDSLRLLLYIVIILSVAGSTVLFSNIFPTWLTFIVVAVILWLGFLWLPTSRLTSLGSRISFGLTPVISWILQYAHPVLKLLSRFIHTHYSSNLQTDIYDKADLLDLLEWQQKQSDNRISPDELIVARHAIEFGDKKVSDILVPRREVRTVDLKESIGPVLMDELHDSGHSRFPVVEGKAQDIVGTLYLRDMLKARHGGEVSSLVKKDVHYIHEDSSLDQVLRAFLKTKHQLFIVVNSFEEFVGIITIEDVLAQVIGRPIADEFDNYDDLKAVAASNVETESIEDEKVSTESPEVVE